MGRHNHDDQTTGITFSLDEASVVSVVSDFNGWDPYANPLIKGANGLRSTVVTFAAGSKVRFRHLTDGGAFFDEGADDLETNESSVSSRKTTLRLLS